MTTRIKMNWSRSRAPDATTLKHLVKVWTDKYGHDYWYDPIADRFWHSHDHNKMPEPLNKALIDWSFTKEGLGR